MLSMTSVTPPNSVKFVKFTVMLDAVGLACTIPVMLKFKIMLPPWAVTLTKAMLVQDVLIVSLIEGSVALISVQGMVASLSWINMKQRGATTRSSSRSSEVVPFFDSNSCMMSSSE